MEYSAYLSRANHTGRRLYEKLEPEIVKQHPKGTIVAIHMDLKKVVGYGVSVMEASNMVKTQFPNYRHIYYARVGYQYLFRV